MRSATPTWPPPFLEKRKTLSLEPGAVNYKLHQLVVRQIEQLLQNEQPRPLYVFTLFIGMRSHQLAATTEPAFAPSK